MRILVVGASGLLGSAVVAALSDRHEVLAASRSGEYPVDVNDPTSIAALYRRTGPLDAVACAAGKTPFAPLAELTREQLVAGLTDKLLGQVELVRQGMAQVADGGSFTLVSGVLSHDPVRTGLVAGTVNGGVDAFVRNAAVELPRGQRINAVSATVFEEAWAAYGPFFPGHRPVPVAEVARAFVKSIEGPATGQIYRVGY
jgi:NAD(P)-dependent dehydrogenase (short-subunit alcohol dehydrogenase family)